MRFLARAQHSPGVAHVDHEDRNAEAIVIAPVLTHEREIFLRQGGQTEQFAFIRQNFQANVRRSWTAPTKDIRMQQLDIEKALNIVLNAPYWNPRPLERAAAQKCVS
jgi:hypothetical protein